MGRTISSECLDLNFGKHGDAQFGIGGPGLSVHQCLLDGLFSSLRIFGGTLDGTTESCQRKQKLLVNNMISHD